MQVRVSSNYFEATTDGKGVKNTYVTTIPKKDGLFTSSVAQSTIADYVQGVINLKKLLDRREM